MRCKKEKHRVTALYSPVKRVKTVFLEYSLSTKKGKIGDTNSIYMALQLTLH